MADKKTLPSTKDLSVIVTVHAESILLHRTLRSVKRALALLDKNNISHEVVIHVDNATTETKEYIAANGTFLAPFSFHYNSFGDLGSSRNFAVRQAVGNYITFIDADDLMSEHWLIRAYEFLQSKAEGTFVAHSEKTVEFGDMDAVILKHGEVSKDADTLLSVYSNRWNSIIMASRQLLLGEPYTANSPGYGYEDWHLNCRLIERGIHNALVPQTVIFVRRKDVGSEWLRQRQSRSILPKNPLFDFSAIRTMTDPFTDYQRRQNKLRARLKNVARPVLRKSAAAGWMARKVYHSLNSLRSAHFQLPAWLAQEWQNMHAVDREVFLSEHLTKNTPLYDSLTPEHYQTGIAFKKIIDHTSSNHYDYLLFVPWLQRGGADSFAINYVNEIQAQCPDTRIAVIATVATESAWQQKLHSGIDFIPLGEISKGLSQDVVYRLLEQFVENSGAGVLHVLNSELAYDFIVDHATYIRATAKKVVVTSFSQSSDETGRIFGYSHTHVPTIYDLATLITSDNQPVVNMWVNEYGFDPAKLVVHHQPVALPEATPAAVPAKELRVLWAARLSPEKQPRLVVEIGRLLADTDITIDMYGNADKDFDTSFLRKLPPNVHYKGVFDGFYTLPLGDYDAYLYTSLFDGMPNAVLEAAAAKLPIVSSSVGGVPDFIHDSENGLLVDQLTDASAYATQLRHLRAHPADLTAYSELLYRKLTRNYSMSAYQKQIADFTQQLGLR